VQIFSIEVGTNRKAAIGLWKKVEQKAFFGISLMVTPKPCRLAGKFAAVGTTNSAQICTFDDGKKLSIADRKHEWAAAVAVLIVVDAIRLFLVLKLIIFRVK
jgi:hypothetical protein